MIEYIAWVALGGAFFCLGGLCYTTRKKRIAAERQLKEVLRRDRLIADMESFMKVFTTDDFHACAVIIKRIVSSPDRYAYNDIVYPEALTFAAMRYKDFNIIGRFGGEKGIYGEPVLLHELLLQPKPDMPVLICLVERVLRGLIDGNDLHNSKHFATLKGK